MTNLILGSLVRLHKDEAGQGLIEYVLIIALVAFAATAGMSSLASGMICALGLASVGALNDIRSGRIPNWLTYTSLAAALVVRGAIAGWPGLWSGLQGVALAGGLFLLLFLLGGMGGGDVKLMAAVAGWAGTAQVAALLIASALAG